MEEWIMSQTFSEWDAPLKWAPASTPPCSRRVKMRRIDPMVRPDLIEYFSSGGQSLHQANSLGQLEYFILVEDPKAVRSVPWNMGLHAQEPSTTVELSLAVYDLPGDPIFYPLMFLMNEPESRYNAAALCEQNVLPIFTVVQKGEEFYLAYCREITLDPEVRDLFRSVFRRSLGLAIPVGLDYPPTKELLAVGWAYQYHEEAIRPYWPSADSVNIPQLRTAMEILAADRNSGIRKGPFLVWACLSPMLDASNQWANAITYIVTPPYEKAAKGRKTDRDPLHEFMDTLPGFIRAEMAHPLKIGAFPVIRYYDGEETGIPLNADRLKLLGELRDAVASSSPWDWGINPYLKAAPKSQVDRTQEDEALGIDETNDLEVIRSWPGAHGKAIRTYYSALLGFDVSSPNITSLHRVGIRVSIGQHARAWDVAFGKVRVSSESSMIMSEKAMPMIDGELLPGEIRLEPWAIEWMELELLGEIQDLESSGAFRSRKRKTSADVRNSKEAQPKGSKSGRGSRAKNTTSKKVRRGKKTVAKKRPIKANDR